MDPTVALTGTLPFVLILSGLLAAICSVFLLWLFRRSVLRGMATSVDSSEPPATEDIAVVSAQSHPPVDLRIQTAGAGPSDSPLSESGYRRARASLHRAMLVYAAGGLAYALVLATTWMVRAGGELVPARFLWLLSGYAWPIVPTLLLLTAADSRATSRIVGIYLACVAAIGTYVLLWNPGVSIGSLVFLWFYENGPATLLLASFLYRRVRAVGPLVFAFMMVGVTGTILVTALVASSDAVLRGIVAVGVPLGLGARELLVLIFLAGFAAFSLVGWWLLGRLGRAYRAKRLSDQSLTIDSIWLIFAVAQTFTFAFEGVGWVLVGVAAWAAYKSVVTVAFRFSEPIGRNARPPMLLLLRVFALGQRSERLFDMLSAWYRRSGSISLIAGPDLVTSTVEPDEFLDFVGGRLTRRFVRSESDLDQRVAGLDREPDPDGRFRVNQFFCRADSWRTTVRRLARDSDAVLMDLRSFSPSNQGCRYELKILLDIVDLERVTLLADATTDCAYLQETLRALWKDLDLASPNRRASSPTVHLHDMENQSGVLVQALLKRLLVPRSSVDEDHHPAPIPQAAS